MSNDVKIYFFKKNYKKVNLAHVIGHTFNIYFPSVQAYIDTLTPTLYFVFNLHDRQNLNYLKAVWRDGRKNIYKVSKTHAYWKRIFEI